MSGEPKAAELLALARTVLAESPRSLRVDRTAAAALLVRQALETAVDDLWADRAPEMAETTDRAQQITLPFYVGQDVGDDVSWAWSRLSYLCHHRAYEMAPTTTELEDLIAAVERLTSHRSASLAE